MRNGLLIDYEFCTGCQSCEVACKEIHNIPVGQWGIRVLDDGPWECSDGKFNWNKIPTPTRLCDLCVERTEKGQQPFCVHHCLAGVMQWARSRILQRSSRRSRTRCSSCPSPTSISKPVA